MLPEALKMNEVTIERKIDTQLGENWVQLGLNSTNSNDFLRNL